MPKSKQWLPADRVQPDFYAPSSRNFQIPRKGSRAVIIKAPQALPINDKDFPPLANGKSVGNGLQERKSESSESATPSQNGLTVVKLPSAVEVINPTSMVIAANIQSIGDAAIKSPSPIPEPSSATAGVPSNTTQPGKRVKPATESNLDIYAHKYVPYWLRAVNESPAVTVHGPHLPSIDIEAYRASFAGRDFLEPLPATHLPLQQPCYVNESQLNPENMPKFWHQRLQNEYAAQALQHESYSLYNVEIQHHDNQQLYKIKIPGVREYIPRIDLGDIVFVRPLVPVLQGTIAQEAKRWSETRTMLAPGFSGQEHHAVVWGIIRRDEYVIVRLGKQLLGPTLCNVRIPLQAHKSAPMWRSVVLAHRKLCSEFPGNTWLRKMLFPYSSDGKMQSKLSTGTFGLQWHDAYLNFEQKRAIQTVVDAQYGQVPYLISGPPGTGKTKTIVETVVQLLKSQQKQSPHLLVCAPSDAAADTLLVRLSAYLRPPDLFRLNNWTRLPAEVPGEVRPYCYLDANQLHSMPGFEILMTAKVVVTSCRDANMLISANLTNHALSQMSLRLIKAISGSSIDSSSLMHWTALLVDEAAQATEPEVLIPLSVVAPLHADNDNITPMPQLIMAGDEYQLGPKLSSAAIQEQDKAYSTQGLEVSLFQRLFCRPLYKDHPLSRRHGLRPLTKLMLPIIRPPFANLIRNYRSHPAILTTSSSLFYSDTLIPERPEVSPSILSWSSWRKSSGSSWPILFHQNGAPDAVESVLEGDGTGAGSITNATEAAVALHHVRSLLSHVNNSANDILHQHDIIVMSPFRAQVRLLRTLFRDNGLYDVRIGPLEAFQGLESRVVILCTTRTRTKTDDISRFVREDKNRGLGIVDAPQIFNVSMTRAKEGLVVIGCSEVLLSTGDKCWRAFLGFCARNGLARSSELEQVKKWEREGKDMVGKLERALVYPDVFKTTNAAEREEENEVKRDEVQSLKFRLQGMMVDLDREIWALQVADEDEKAIRREEDEDDEAVNGEAGEELEEFDE